MSYKAEHYNAVLKPYQARFKIANDDLTPGQWMFNRREVKAMFDENFLIADILSAFDEACKKRRWPSGTPFFRRVHDVLLVRQRDSWTGRKDGMHGLGDILQRKHLAA